ncbi:hypothetical protein CLV63_14033 [Murinocardiopsis flavida]|uniref:Uncharacterized protein n=1 Tax=Murinocardiopsis flavida TaxID=645275 RepID=A0A2P8CF37_9ACTN|nr:DUF6204 family protein [Murinocardiopsis flavida]PSK83581.1 hypothetical protein CLV63_14033 [Murinocardiopsis flavida]
MDRTGFQIMVRGRFEGLADDARAGLLAEVAEHDVFAARFTEDGTLTYDATITWFTFRYLVHAENAESAEATALDLATTALSGAGRAHGDLRCTTTDMALLKINRKKSAFR